MAQRNVLHINKLDALKEYLDSKQIPYRPGKGYYQVLQIFTRKHGWQCIYQRHNMPEHYTIHEKLYPLIRKFINENRNHN